MNNLSNSKLSISLCAEVNYSFRDKVSKKSYCKKEIDARVKQFSNLNRETGNHISHGKEVSGMVGRNLLKWLKESNSSQEKVRVEFTKRVIGLVEDLKTEKEFADAAVTFSGENVDLLDVDLLRKAKLSFKITNDSIITGPQGGKFNADFLDAVNANQPRVLTRDDIEKKGDCADWAQFETNYNQFIERLQTSNGNPTYQIPKKVHLIWIGPKQPSEEVHDVQDSWKTHHPGWDVKLWGNDEAEALVAEYSLKFPNIGEAWKKAVKWAEKADIVRYCVLHKEGGIYADTDLPCYGKVDDLHCNSDFFAGLEMSDHGHGILYTGNALIGAKAGHPIIEGCLKNLKPRKEKEGEWDIIGRTGPGLLTDQIYQGLRKDIKEGTHTTLLLPPAYFYPLHSGSREKAKDAAYTKKCILSWTKGLHLWNLSWAK